MSGKTYLRNQTYFKPNYFKALKYILPEYLYEDDIEGTAKDVDVVDTLINSHLDIANNISSVLHVSAVSHSLYSSIDSFEGISPFFVKQNQLTNITTQEFEDDVLTYFDRTFASFETLNEFDQFLEDTLLPAINLNNPDSTYFGSIGSTSAIHNYLINKLSWMYFLNTSGASFDPSSYVKGLITSSLFVGNPVSISDGIKGLTEFVWRNEMGDYYPSSLFAPGSSASLSGTQQLDKLTTWVDVAYSPLYADKSDFTVRDRFQTFFENSIKYTDKVESGPFARLIRSLSFLAFDINNQTEEIASLYDIDDCPDDYLPLVAQLIGWDLYGDDANKWRLQLRNAVSIYKTIGTKKAIQSTVNTVFPKDKFPIESRITEMWESYVPYLIYYALATESDKFKDFQTWNRDEAENMDVEGYSTNSMDENIRMAVDRILLETVQQFPDSFSLTYWIEQSSLSFNYRGRVYPIPPFEEYPYYVNVELNQDMISFIADRLACFGVRQEFALDVSSYISSNALNVDDEPRAGSWLLFTSGYNSPPNLDNLILNLNDNRFDYASLWSGKSSHFKLVLDASEFDFTKKGLTDVDSGDAIGLLSQSVLRSAPAHSIPLISLEVSGEPDLVSLEGSSLPLIYYDKTEINVGAGNNYFTKGFSFNSYKRGINPGGSDIQRSATESLASPEFREVESLETVSVVGAIPRNTSRRRSYEKVMPFNGYYDRTGFNMPVGFSMASGLSGIPLGLVPSSLGYTPVTSHVNLPAIWAQCEGLNSTNSYYEYDVSNTQNVRGIASTFQSNSDYTTDRGQLPGIYASMHRISENEKYLRSYLVSGPIALKNQIAITTDETELNTLRDLLTNQTRGILQSYANGFSNSSVVGYAFPESTSDYYNFEFGRDLHRLYHQYKDNFKWHRLSPEVQELDGANLFSHVFGPLVYNHNFEKLGNVTELVSTSFASPAKISVTSTPFTGAGSFAASSPESMYLDTPERVSSGIIDGVELVLTSGTSENNSFSIIKVPGSSKKSYEETFLFDKTLLLMRSGFGALTRIRFDISKYEEPSNHPISKNFLTPDHDFKIDLNSIISNDAGTFLGGRRVGVWIHTKPESGKMWTYDKYGKWIHHDQRVSRSQLMSRYGHIKSLAYKPNDPESTNTPGLECIDNTGTSRTSPVIGLGEDDFENFEIHFDTRNRELIVPKDYQSSYGQIHRLTQEYVVEVFMAPGSQPDEFMLIDKVSIQDLTLKTLSEVFAAGTLSDPLCSLSEFKYGCEEYRVELSKKDLFDVLKHFNNLSGKNAAVPYASRDKDKTETIMGSQGGSKVNYVFTDEFVGGKHLLNPILHLEVIFYS